MIVSIKRSDRLRVMNEVTESRTNRKVDGLTKNIIKTNKQTKPYV